MIVNIPEYIVKVNVEIAPSLQVWVEFALLTMQILNVFIYYLYSLNSLPSFQHTYVPLPSPFPPVSPFVPLFTIHWFFLLLCGACYQIWLAQKKNLAYFHVQHTHTYMYIWITHTHAHTIFGLLTCATNQYTNNTKYIWTYRFWAL